ncbi:peptide-methionine (S)-S-oxide reductase MsrA [Foetidibacter luteolus]|uniref:peptide-methionine (S)-S-oxide reductase MsrA n=1 Tax=Foetidibacter luteolus TaxID=2608880 RepID=UPI00129C0CB4|nr:peptide-methionine (S)-S-oxide reductase MsrA [Foetidibacter luteolus]
MGTWLSGAFAALLSLTSCVEQNNQKKSLLEDRYMASFTAEMDTATFGTGCFWCTEAVFQRLDGVAKVISGYSGGTVDNPTYEQVCSGRTGHAECCQVLYDPSKITYAELLEVFWKTHDPTTLNRQGNDVGTQYRSAIFYHNGEQKEEAQHYIDELNKSGAYKDPIVTTLEPYTKFYSAENYHQNYYNSNPNQMYCRYVIQPKLEKFEKVFKDKLKH